MPSKHCIKEYAGNSYYHAYNRGVEKRNIFKDKQDYHVFLNYLKEYLTPPPSIEDLLKTIYVQGRTFQAIPRQPKNYHKEIELTAYCLMPNHFHFLIKQNSKFAIKEFMRSILTRYSMYFNKKYDRIGSLFQGRYKAILIKNEDYLLHLTRYIHRNPLEEFKDPKEVYSSYQDYLGKKKTSWLKNAFIIQNFKKSPLSKDQNINTYEKFVKALDINSKNILGEVAMD